MSPSLSIIVASSGRNTLKNTMASVQAQMVHGDELLVSVQTDCPWGHAARNQLMRAARGAYMLFIDDDDVYVDGALDVVRQAVAYPWSRSEWDYHMHIFRMRYVENGFELWKDQEVRSGNVSTQMVVVPSIVRLLANCEWGNRYEGDFDFILACSERLGVHWHEDVIALVRQGATLRGEV